MALDPRIPLGVMTPGQAQSEALNNTLKQQQVQQNEQSMKQQQEQAGKPDLAEMEQKLELGMKLLSTVKDQASYDRAKQLAEQYGISDLEMLPPEYDPQIVEQLGQATMTFADQLAQQRLEIQQQTLDLSRDKFEHEKTQPAPYQGGGDTGRLVDRLIQEGQAGNVAEALELIKGGAGARGKFGAEIDMKEDIAQAKGRIKEGENFGGAVGSEEGKGFANLGKLEASARTFNEKGSSVLAKIEEILPRVNNLTAGFGGTMLSAIPQTAARDLQRELDTVLANVGFDELQEMRNNSPTGGALGQVTEREIAFLQALKSNLQQDQSPEQLVKNLQQASAQIKQSMQRIQDAYEADLERFGASAMRNIGRGVSGQQGGSGGETGAGAENDPLGIR